jgi:hypothetical protein
VHIALLFSGHKRSFMAHVKRWKEFIADLESDGAIVHCFYHSWSEDCEAQKLGNQRIEGSYVKKPLGSQGEIINALPFKHGWFEDEAEILPQLILPPNALLLTKQAAKKNIALQLYSMQKSYEAMQMYENEQGIKYCTIVKLRFDVEPRRWDKREFFLFNQPVFAKLLIASNNYVHDHPGGGGGCLQCDKLHTQWWENNFSSPLPVHDGAHSNDICDLYAIGNQETMGRYMTVYSRILQLYPEELFRQSLQIARQLKKRSLSSCLQDANDWRIDANGIEMENENMACFYPERLQRLNLAGFSVLHAASMFYRD